MKPETFKQPLKCEGFFTSLPLRLSLLWGYLLLHGKKLLPLAPVSRVIRAILLAVPSNGRQYAVVLLVVGAPLVMSVFLMFDPAGGDPSAYWNTYFFLFAIKGELFALSILSAFWLKFKQEERTRYSLFIPSTYVMGRILWLAFVTDNPGYHAIMHWSFLFLGLGTAVLWFLLFDYLMHLHYHRKAGHLCRAEGLLKEKSIDDKYARAMALSEIMAYKNL